MQHKIAQSALDRMVIAFCQAAYFAVSDSPVLRTRLAAAAEALMDHIADRMEEMEAGLER